MRELDKMKPKVLLLTRLRAGSKRAQARAYFETFVESCYQLTQINEIWDAHEFVKRTKAFLEVITNVAKGRFGEKITPRTLWGKSSCPTGAERPFPKLTIDV
jgi:hypothetical protein